MDAKMEDLHAKLVSDMQLQRTEILLAVDAKLEELRAKLAAERQLESAHTVEVVENLRESVRAQQVEVVENLRTANDRHLADSDLALGRLRTDLTERMADFEAVFKELTALDELEPRLEGCELIIKELRAALEVCDSNVNQSAETFQKVSGQQAQIQDDTENIHRLLEETMGAVEKLEDDLALHRKSATATCQEVEKLMGVKEQLEVVQEQLAGVQEQLGETEVTAR